MLSNKNNILGLTLLEAIGLLDEQDITYYIEKTTGLNSQFNKGLNEPRVLRVTENDNDIKIIVGYF